MAIWIWRLRRTMLEKARWIALMASRRFAKLATTSRKCRMLISGQVPGAWKACGPIRTPSARIPIRAAELFLRTTEASQTAEFSPAGQLLRAEGAFQSGTRKAGMLAGQNFFHKVFARVSPVFLVAGFVFASPQFSPGAVSGAQPNSAASGPSEDSETHNASNRRQAASTQFARAEDLRAQLNSKPAEKRALSEYKQVVSSYRRVYLITPHAVEVPDALLAIAELYSEMGDKFGRSYYQVAADSYKFLLHEYPTSRYGQDAMLRMARLQKDQLGDAASSAKTFEEFLKKYPHSPRKREAQESLAELALLRNSEQSPVAKSEAAGADSEKTAEAAESARRVPAEAVPVYSAANAGRVPRLRRIGTSTSTDSTRVTIDLEDLVQYSSARIRNPDRIFFDLHAARLTSELARQDIHVEGDLLSAVRVAQNQAGVVRVVLNVNGVKDYTASLLTNPPQLVIDLYRDAAPGMRAAKSKSAALPPASEESTVDGGTVVADQRAGAAAAPGAASPARSTPPGGSSDSATLGAAN